MNDRMIAEELLDVAGELTANKQIKSSLTVNDLLEFDDRKFDEYSKKITDDWKKGGDMLSYGIVNFSPNFIDKSLVDVYWKRIPPLAREYDKIKSELKKKEQEEHGNNKIKGFGGNGLRYDEDCAGCSENTTVDNYTDLCKKCYKKRIWADVKEPEVDDEIRFIDFDGLTTLDKIGDVLSRYDLTAYVN